MICAWDIYIEIMLRIAGWLLWSWRLGQLYADTYRQLWDVNPCCLSCSMICGSGRAGGDQNLLSAISGDCNQKDAGTFWTCWWITRWRHLKVQPFSNVWWNYTRLNDSGIEQLVIFHDMNQLAKNPWPDFFHGTSIRQASIQFRRWPDFEERNLTVKING